MHINYIANVHLKKCKLARKNVTSPTLSPDELIIFSLIMLQTQNTEQDFICLTWDIAMNSRVSFVCLPERTSEPVGASFPLLH